MVVTLIGYRGCGKSTLAEPLARQLGWAWIDADIEIERRSGQSIREIFDHHGEAEFRKIEKDVLTDLLLRQEVVIAAGGGAVLDADLRAAMHQAGLVVWLKASVQTLAERILGDPTTTRRRPNLTKQGGLAEIENLLATREPLYRECSHRELDVETGSPEELARTIAAWAESWPMEEPSQ